MKFDARSPTFYGAALLQTFRKPFHNMRNPLRHPQPPLTILPSTPILDDQCSTRRLATLATGLPSVLATLFGSYIAILCTLLAEKRMTVISSLEVFGSRS